MNFDVKFSQRTALMVMAFCGFLWSTSGALIKLVSWNPLTLAWGRSLVASAAIFLFLLVCRKKPAMTRIIFWAAVAGCFKNISFVTANKLTSAANVIAIQYTNPIFVVIFMAIFFKQMPRRKDVAVSLITVFGVMLLVFDGLSADGIAGNALALVSGILTAVTYIVTGRLSRYEESISVHLFGHAFVALVLIPVAFVYPPSMTPGNITGLLLLGLVQQALSLVLFSFAIRNASIVACSIVACVDPLLNPVWTALLVKEIPGPYTIAGFAVILGAITLWSLSDALLHKKQQADGEEQP